MAVELSDSAKRKLKKIRRKKAQSQNVGSGGARKAIDTVARTQGKREARLDDIMAQMRGRQSTDSHQ